MRVPIDPTTNPKAGKKEKSGFTDESHIEKLPGAKNRNLKTIDLENNHAVCEECGGLRWWGIGLTVLAASLGDQETEKDDRTQSPDESSAR